MAHFKENSGGNALYQNEASQIDILERFSSLKNRIIYPVISRRVV